MGHCDEQVAGVRCAYLGAVQKCQRALVQHGHDVLDGGLGNDALYGSRGLDRLVGDQGDDTLDGGATYRLTRRLGRSLAA